MTTPKTAAIDWLANMLSQAVALQRAGRFSEAERLCETVLKARPTDATALHVQGVCQLHRGDFAAAEQCLAASLKSQPHQAAALTNRGIALQALKRVDEALDCYERSLALSSRQPATLNMQGLALTEVKRHEDALRSFDAAVTIAPHFAEGWCGRANALAQLGRFDDALASLDRAQELRPDYPEALSNRAIVLNALGRHEEALAAADQAAVRWPGHPVVLRSRGTALAGLRRLDEAIASFDQSIALNADDGDAVLGRALALEAQERWEPALQDMVRAIELLGDRLELLLAKARLARNAGQHELALQAADLALTDAPDHPGALSERMMSLASLKRFAEALAACDRLLELQPGRGDALLLRGQLLNEVGRSPDALDAFETALAAFPDQAANVYVDRSVAFAAMGRYDEALADLQHAMEQDPSLSQAHWNEALFRLLLGDYETGWRKYEYRWKNSDFTSPKQPFRQPQWQGDEDLTGKTVFLHAEQGFGDAIQFSRYARLLAARGAKVIVGAHRPLKALFQTLDGVADVIASGDPLPAFDLHCPLMSLPLAFGTRVDSIPAEVPYLKVDAERRSRWGERLGPKSLPRVGLVWSGSPQHADDRRRSITLAMMESVLANDAEFFALNKAVREEERPELQRLRIRHFGEEQTDFAETAALIDLMDLVISVDTSIAHLAGALGKPVWILLANPPDYRWLLHREDSPWYPTARLFRQSERGNWNAVVSRVAGALQYRLASEAQAST